MPDDLISRKAFDASLAEAQYKCKSNGGNFRFGVLSNVRENLAKQPAVDAVPMDKLCEWLAGNAWHLDCSDCDGEHCDCIQFHDDSNDSPEFWKAKLTKWMEEKNAPD